TILRTTTSYEEAKKALTEASEICHISQDSVQLAECQYQMGALLCRMDNNDAAIQSIQEAIELSKNIKRDDITAKALNVLGIIYKQNSQYEEAIQTYKESLEIHHANNSLKELAIGYNGLGVAQMKIDLLQEAKISFQKALDYSIESGNVLAESYQYRNLGAVALQMDQLDSAEILHNKALNFRRRLGNPLALGGSHSDLAEVLLKKGEPLLAKPHLDSAFTLFQEMNSTSSLNLVRSQLADYHFEVGNFNESRNLLERYYEIRDSLESLELKTNLADIRTKYDTEKKEAELAQQNLTIEEQENDNLKLVIGVVVLFCAVGFLFLMLRFTKRKKQQEITSLKREQQVQALKYIIQGEEKERNRIGKELHDGVNGDLSALKFKLHSLAELNQQLIGEAIEMVDQSYEQVRAISHNLTPPALSELQLEDVLQDYCSKINASGSMDVEFTRLGGELNVDKETEINLFRMVQELVSNALKHANANQILLQMSVQNNTLQITVEDDGEGFDKQKVSSGLGMKNLESRAVYINASLDISTGKNGTSVTIEKELND
ncbi:MAG: tetratricopeptide repeat protein, partial [Bacteroidota bacterium]